MDRYTVADGIVIRRKALPSGDVVVTLLSEDGKWRAIGRKGRTLGGNVGRLSLFHDVRVQYYRKNPDDLALLTQVSLNGALPNLSRPEVYPYAHLLAELTDVMTVDVHLGSQAYTYLTSGLRGLDRHPDPARIALAYAWKMLGLAGMAPITNACATCGAPPPLTYFDVAGGGSSCDACARGTHVGPTVTSELHRFNAAGLRTVIASQPHDVALHWHLLARYLAFHVGDLRSLGPLANGTVASSLPLLADSGGA